MEQRSPEWFAARLGKVTASRVADVIAKTKTGPAATRINYAAELLVERLTGASPERFTNTAMQWGADNEPAARDAYSFLRDVDVEEVGFVVHPRISDAGASPDGLVGDDGMVEIKCPNTATHLDTLDSGKPAGKYITQMMWQMACCDRQWCDFVSFDPRLPEELRLFVVRIDRDDDMIESLEAEVIAFLVELDARIASLSAKYGVQPMAIAA